jgi:mono/diheme cytochrome c family protein
MTRYISPILLGAIIFFAIRNGTATAQDSILYNRDIRPLLSDHCFACHGPDANQREADLRLDTEEGLATVTAGGDLEESLLYHHITSKDDGEIMPPAEFGKPLSDDQILMIGRWIKSGAAWQGHWAFQPMKPYAAPELSTVGAHAKDFVQNDIDRFTLQAMKQNGFEPSPRADRRTLIRRLSFDLTGLPPSPETVRQFIEDDRPDAYERLVDQLLDSPHYGERMAMWWLDLVRYADTVGYHGDQDVSVSPYRDYVIESFASNKPFDQFTLEQLAGDLLENPTQEQLIASGYNRLGMMSAEGGVQPKEYLAKYIAERVRNLGGTWMGVTLGCCECHDHKYDPFTMKDFYSFEAFFADIEEQGLYAGANRTGKWGAQIQVPTLEQTQRLEELNRQIEVNKKILSTSTPELVEAQKAWEATVPNWQVLTADAIVSVEGATLEVQEDGSILARGKNPATDTYRLSYAQVPAAMTAIRIEVIPDPSLPAKGSGRAGNGNFVLSELLLRKLDADGQEIEILELQNPTATYEQTGAAGGNPYKKWAIASAVDRDEKGKNWGWAIMEKSTQPQAAVIELANDLTLKSGETLSVELLQNHDQHTIGRFRLSATSAPRPMAANTFPADLVELLKRPADERTDAQRDKLAEYYRSRAPLLEPTRKKLTQLNQQKKELSDSIVTTLVTRTVEPRMVRVLPRGNWMDESGTPLSPAFPDFLQVAYVSDSARMSRLDLAQWLLHPENPLTTRVFANRIWKLLFGRGLSAKLDDLGAQGDWPSHPELLDHLASEFLKSGWDVKALVKMMVMSGTYQQASVADAQSLAKDPLNQWIGRQSRYRLDAEMVRDNALAISGLLVRDLGGESVKPYQPEGYWAYLNFPTRTWKADQGEDLYRRGLYVHWQRQYLHPSLLAFDAPSREECTADRPRSNTPLQSLVLLNDPIFVEAARVFAEGVLTGDGVDDATRLEWAFDRGLNRKPTEQEATILLTLLNRHREDYRTNAEAAQQLISIGDSPTNTELDSAELAAWTNLCRTLLNLHETITRN